jgi:hypothetical protein
MTLKTEAMDTHVHVCHCTMCRKWSGGPFFAVNCGSAVQIEGEDHIDRYDSSEWAQRAFCKNCGSALFYMFKPSGTYEVSAHLFEYEGMVFTDQIFTDEKPGYYAFSNETKNMTGAEVFSAFESKDN